MFNIVLDPTPTYWWDVELLVAAGDGSIKTHSFRVQYRRLDEDEMEALNRDINEQSLSDRQVARRVMCGWAGIAGEGGVELPYSDSNRDKLLSVPGAATAIVGAFFISRSQAALGNLQRSRAAGLALTPSGAATTSPSSATH